MYHIYSLLFTLFILPLYPFYFSELAFPILQEFQIKQRDTSFAKDLYDYVGSLTENFSKKATFFEMERNLPIDYLDYMASYFANTDPDALIAIIWPTTRKYDREIYDCFEKTHEIVAYKRICFDQNGARNFLEQLPIVDVETMVEMYFPEQLSDWPLRIYLLKPHSHSQEGISKSPLEQRLQCFKNLRGKVFLTSTREEIRTITELVFNLNSVHFLKQRKRTPLENFAIRMQALQKLPCEHSIVTGPAVFAAYGLCDAQEWTILETLPKSSEYCYAIQSRANLMSNIGFSRNSGQYRKVSIDDLLYNPRRHFYFNHRKFTSLECTYTLAKITNDPHIHEYKKLLRAL